MKIHPVHSRRPKGIALTNDYQPIACSTHSEYELMAMHRKRVEITGTNGTVVAGTVVDVVTANGAEYLCLELSPGNIQNIRLDQIQTVSTAA
jgi:transcriptional antiterminator Rof (Rho-off)